MQPAFNVKNGSNVHFIWTNILDRFAADRFVLTLQVNSILGFFIL